MDLKTVITIGDKVRVTRPLTAAMIPLKGKVLKVLGVSKESGHFLFKCELREKRKKWKFEAYDIELEKA